MITPSDDDGHVNRQAFIPGYVLAKRLVLWLGVAVLAVGGLELWHPLRLVLFGARAKAEAIRVVKEKPGLPPRLLVNPAEVLAQLEPRDRSFVFWNEFRFVTREGHSVEVRANAGSQLKPLYPLIDADGLPTVDLVCYDPSSPAEAIFPLIASTWLAPGVLALAGLAAALIAGVLLHWARKPIELPTVQK